MGGEVERGEGGQTKKIGFDGIPRDFELNDYLAIIQGETTGEIIELPVSSWMFLECMMALFYLVYLVVSTFWFSIIFVAAAYALMLVNFFMDRKLISIIRHLTPRVFYKQAEDIVTNGTGGIDMGERSGLGGASVGDYQSVSGGGGAEGMKPRYLKLKQLTYEEWGSTRRYLFGRLPDQHEQLWWGGSKGPELMLFMIRIQLIWSAIYISVFLVVLLRSDVKAFQGQPLGMIVMIIFVVIPVAVNFIQLAHIMRNYVIASSIELMKKQKVIRRVRRRMTTKKAVRCLKLLRLMKKKVPKAGSGRKPGEAAKTAEEIYKDEHVLRKKRRELQELFDLFDKDKSGDISSAEMLELLQLLKMAEDETQARDMLAELDDDQSGTVEFQEFFNWMASNDQEEETEESIEEYIDGMFDMIDTDESGTITAEEFQTTLKNLGTDLTMEDIQCMIREVDENGDGDIDREEFKEMVIKNMEQV